MTKTELLRRYHWLWDALPIATALAFCILFVAVEKNWIHFGLRTGQIVDIAFTFAPIGWLALTTACSAATAFVRCQETQLRGVVRILVMILVAVMLTAVQVLACGAVLGVLAGSIA